VAEAYLSGLEALASKGKSLEKVTSVASFFLSRIDVLLDPMFEQIMRPDGRQADIAERLHGQVAIASAKVAYQIYKEIFDSDRFRKLAERGAKTQRLLWASTSTKNPAYADTKYVEPLIGPDTINTVPVETLDAYRDHGHPKQTLDQSVSEAKQTLSDLSSLGISLEAVTQQLEDEGVEKFVKAFDKLISSLKEKQQAMQESLKH
jgi:transaldolase